MKAILSEAGVAFSATEYIAKYGNEKLLRLQKQFTIRTVDRTTKIPQITKMYKMINMGNTKIIELPRFTKDILTIKDSDSWSTPIAEIETLLPRVPISDKFDYTGCSNPNQKVVVKHIVNHCFNKDIGGVTLKLLAGQGKTYCAMDIIAQMKMKTLIVVPNTYLLEQWVDLISKHYPNINVGMLYGKAKRDGDIIIGIINTVAELQEFTIKEKVPTPNIGKTLKYVTITKMINVNELYQSIGLTVFDESQMYVSKEFRKVFQRIHSRYTLGLSATPDIREDKLDKIHHLWVGPILDAESLEGFNVSQDKFTSDIHLIKYHALNQHCKFNIREDGMVDYSSIIESIVNDPNRNAIIINKILMLMDKGMYVFVFSDRRSHLEHLFKLLQHRCIEDKRSANLEIPEAQEQIILYGGSTDETIQTAKTISSVVFTTYAYSSVGVSITKMNALVMSTPRRSNMKQIINRVFRLGSDQSIKRIIIDVCDEKLPIKGQHRERLKAYEERGGIVKKTKIDANDISIETTIKNR